jgi:hypothetical protein
MTNIKKSEKGRKLLATRKLKQKVALQLTSSCDKPCSPSDWCKGGKCDLNGCYQPEN